MDKFYEWKPEYSNVFITIISVSIGFSTNWFLAQNEKIKAKIFIKYGGENAWIAWVIFQKLIGILFMGLVPGIVLLSVSDYTLPDLGINLKNYKESLIYAVSIGLLICSINYFVSKNAFNLRMYPQMRVKRWNIKRIAINSIAWTAYLITYEFMYRGLLLFVCYYSFGFWPAVAINLSFYSATHIAKGSTETFGTFPFGLLLCFITISTGSLFAAFLIHLILALSNDYFAVHHNPEMKIE